MSQAAAVGLCALAFLAFPVASGVHSSFVVAGVFRGVWAGLAGGLAMPKTSWRSVACVAALGTLPGGVAAKYGLSTIAAWEIVVAIGVAVLAALAVHWLVRHGWKRAAVAIALVCIGAGLAWQVGLVPGPFSASHAKFLEKTAIEPVAETYDFDGHVFLKTMFLMKHGTPYFAAFSQAITGDSRYVEPPKLIFNYREAWPARFVVLLPFNAGLAAWGTFLALVLISMVSAYWLSSQFVTPGAALLGPMLLVSYFAFPLTTKWFPLVELWAGALAILGIALFLHERWWPAVLVVTVAVAMRELMVYLIPVGGLAWLLYPRRREVVLQVVALVALPCAVIVYQILSAPGVLTGGGTGGLAIWMHGGPATLTSALRFSTKYLAWGEMTALAVPIVALAGAMQAPAAWRKTLLGSAVVVPAVALGLFSTGVYGNYWGGIVQPVALATVPLAFLFALPRNASELELSDPRFVVRRARLCAEVPPR